MIVLALYSFNSFSIFSSHFCCNSFVPSGSTILSRSIAAFSLAVAVLSLASRSAISFMYPGFPVIGSPFISISNALILAVSAAKLTGVVGAFGAVLSFVKSSLANLNFSSKPTFSVVKVSICF